MAKKVVWTESAWIDLESVADFVARDSPYYAASFVREIRNHARSLSRMSAAVALFPRSAIGVVNERSRFPTTGANAP